MSRLPPPLQLEMSILFSERGGNFFFALESGQPDSWKIKSTLLWAPEIKNLT